MCGDFNNFVCAVRLIDDRALPIYPIEVKVPSSSMESSHPVRQRVGVVLVCLIALLTAREGWNFRIKPPNLNSAPKHVPTVPKAPENRPLDATIDRESFRRDSLRPLCTLEGNPELPCCDLTSRLADSEPEVVFQLNPDTFPLSAQFVPGAVPGGATIKLALLEKVEQIEPIQPDSYLLWLPPLSKCSNVKKDSHGKEYCAAEETTEVPEVSTLVLALTAGGALLLNTRRNS